ncbi:MAG: DNA recombination protein [Gammaproteobacteria bacterium RIFOXYA12_FULL_61_12]|nr:MAG: DNA recombination protein [Gammaproteobacteria bacterium RIFOXYD12_FULL_61_37]OGT93996.1 MAG: DNA recombination protein [Gammaproteobacteria bacterium RIFOXYA12_FULL_61_12]
MPITIDSEILWLMAGAALALLILLVWFGLRGQLRALLLRQEEMQEAYGERFHEQQERFDHAMAELRDSQINALLRLQRGIMEQGNGQTHLLERRLGEIQLNLVDRFVDLEKATSGGISEGRMQQQQTLADLQAAVQRALVDHREHLEQRQTEQGRALQETLHSGMEATGRQVVENLARNTEELGKRMAGLTETTEKRLGDISGQVEKRLSDGFEKTTETFSQVLQHLTRIDEAQKKITELSTNVVSLQEVLADKRSRGAFGEVQLAGLMRNLMPERSFALQHTLKNGNRVDCMLFLPEPTGNVPIDAKFPLESYQRMADPHLADTVREQAGGQFQKDVRKHIDDIASKYIVPGETSEGAVMFIPAEAVFAEIHAHFPALIEEAHRKRVWLVSPTTLMAVLTTARAVLKDAETRMQVHIIQDHLQALSKDFGRFRNRMDNLAKHIKQASQDVSEIHVSADKISSRFEKIERVELEELGEPASASADQTPMAQ